MTRVLDDTGEATTFAPLHDGAVGLDARPRVRHGAQPLGAAHVGGRVRGVDGARRPACRAASRRRRGARAAPRGAPPPGGRLGRRARRRGRPRRRRRRGPAARRPPAARRVRATSRRPGRACSARRRGRRSDLAGHGVADPSPMLLATALLLSEGLGRAAAGEALEESLTAALQRVAAPVRRRRARASRRRPASSSTRCSACCASARRDTEFALGVGPMKMTGGDAILRSLEAEGVDVMFGIPGGRDHADLRRDGPRDDRAARPRPPRAGRGPHGAGLRARVGPGRRRDRHVGARRDEPRHADRRRVDGLDAARLHHGTGALEPDRHGRLPGVRHHRDHDADRQALVARLRTSARSRP